MHSACSNLAFDDVEMPQVAGYAACLGVVHKCIGFQRRDGALIHSLCPNVEPEVCREEAQNVLDMWPECADVLNNGTYKCTAVKASKLFNLTVEEICRPFDNDDYLF